MPRFVEEDSFWGRYVYQIFILIQGELKELFDIEVSDEALEADDNLTFDEAI